MPASLSETTRPQASMGPRRTKLQRLTDMARNTPFSSSVSDTQNLKNATSNFYTFFEKVHREQENATIPPLELLVYAVRDMIYPTFIGHHRISDILHILQSVEHYRMRALSRAESAQGFNKYYSACIPDNVDLLTPEERNVELLTEAEQEILARMIAEGPGTRKQYVDLVLGYYQLDIYYLFSNSPDDLESRLEMYNRCDPFTPEEQNFLRDAIGKIAVDPVMRNRVRDSAKGYRCPVKLEDHMKATELYLQRVENDVSALKAMFRE